MALTILLANMIEKQVRNSSPNEYCYDASMIAGGDK
jgi:hypothetical protein